MYAINISRNICKTNIAIQIAKFSSTHVVSSKDSYELLIIGGGAGGCAAGAKFSSYLGQGKVAIIEPYDIHYYQPMFTMISGGMKQFKNSFKPMEKVLPKKADWIQDSVAEFDPDNNCVTTRKGKKISYKYLVVAMGLQLDYYKIPGALEALKTPNNGVGSNYSPLYVQKTFHAMQNFKEGHAVFSFPNTPVKCAGAPQKVVYITDDYLRRNGKRDKAIITYNTSLPVLFGIKKYADALWKVVESRDIKVNTRTNLVEVRPDKKQAIFQNLDNPQQKLTFEYEMLHITPPMSTPDALCNNKKLADNMGFLNVNKETLQHVNYPNIFGIGDCTNCPTAKTAAAVAGQVGILRHNLKAAMAGKQPHAIYDGYTSCPIVTGRGKAILAEFDYNGNPLETFPLEQGKERWTMYFMKKTLMPEMYWWMLLTGWWEGPGIMRKIMHLGLK